MPARACVKLCTWVYLCYLSVSLCIPVYTRCIPVYTCVYLRIPAYSYLCIPVYPCVSLCIPVYPCVYLRIPAYTRCNPAYPCVSLCILVYTWLPALKQGMRTVLTVELARDWGWGGGGGGGGSLVNSPAFLLFTSVLAFSTKS